MWHPVFPALFVEDAVFPLQSVFWCLGQISGSYNYECLTLELLLCFTDLHIYFCSCTILFLLLWLYNITWRLVRSFFSIILFISGFPWLSVLPIEILFFYYCEVMGILIRIALSLYIAFSRTVIFKILILLIQECGMSFYLLVTASMSFFRHLK